MALAVDRDQRRDTGEALAPAPGTNQARLNDLEKGGQSTRSNITQHFPNAGVV